MPYKNIEDRRASSKRSYEKHKNHILATQKAKREENIEEFRIERQEYYNKNAKRINDHSKTHYNKNKEYYKQKHKEWRESHPEYRDKEREYEKDRYANNIEFRIKKIAGLECITHYVE